MSAFLICQQSNESTEIPDGETAIGRGPFLKVVDKRVSRSHAVVKWHENVLAVKPVHKNLSFFCRYGETSYVVLPKEEWKELFHGDKISLLPNDLIFTVEVSNNDQTQLYDIVESEDATLPIPEDDIDSFKFSSNNKVEEDDNDVPSMFNSTSDDIATKPEALSSSITGKKRCLPNWMLNSTANVSSTKKSPTKRKAKVTTDKNDVKKALSSKKSQNDDNLVESKKMETVVEENVEEPLVRDNKVPPPKQATESEATSDQKKPACPYGSNCFRKNPAHFNEFSHDENEPTNQKVGNPVDEVDKNDKPECEYGTSCYRTNPQHLREYKHTKTPEHLKEQRTTRRQVKKGKSVHDNASDDDGEQNTYDYNDSFLDDDDDDVTMMSSDSYEDEDDSDFNPNDPENEDVNELVSEANEFIKNKKLS